MEFPDGVHHLDTMTPLHLQALRLAGWYPGRHRDISGQISNYERMGVQLPVHARQILSEFCGLPASWNWRWTYNQRVHIGGYDYSFDTDAAYADCDDEQERSRLPETQRAAAIPLMYLGWHQFPWTIWLGSDDLMYTTNDLAEARVFGSVLGFLEWNLTDAGNGGIFNNEEVYLTFHAQSLLHWDEP